MKTFVKSMLKGKIIASGTYQEVTGYVEALQWHGKESKDSAATVFEKHITADDKNKQEVQKVNTYLLHILV